MTDVDTAWIQTCTLIATSSAVPFLAWRSWDLSRKIRAQGKQAQEVTEALKSQLHQSEDAFQQMEVRHLEVRRRLGEAGLFECYRQPVLLVGPRSVGKTSLLSHWRTPWSRAANQEATVKHNVAEVPICNFPLKERRPHFADPELKVPVTAQLMLRVHDFPGEVSTQRLIEKTVRDETAELRRASSHDLGVVVICMFDASEAVQGIAPETKKYYNGELFQRLRGLVFESAVKIERLVMVFNKHDHLRRRRPPTVSDADLLEECNVRFLSEFRELQSICNPGRLASVLTMLDRESNRDQTRGSPVVFGEAARALVEAFGDTAPLRNVLAEPARVVPAAHYTRNETRAPAP